MTNENDILERLREVISNAVLPSAVAVDKSGRFPEEAIAALGEAGFLGMTVPSELGGGGRGPDAAVTIVGELSAVCGSTAMVVAMHYAATAALVAGNKPEPLREIATGKHLTSLAFSEVGSRSHFWVPGSTATAAGDEVQLDARKSWVTSAAHADSYVWSSRPLESDGAMTLWHVPAATPGLKVSGGFDGLGLRGNGSTPMTANGAIVPRSAIIGDDGAGLDLALSTVLPWFLLLNAASSVGLMQAVTSDAVAHTTTTRLEHLNQTLAEQLPTRTKLAVMRYTTDRTLALLSMAVDAVESQDPGAVLLVLEAKAVADEAATEVTDLAMAACGGAAFRKELSIERRFRDSRAARVMAPTHDALLDLIGRAMGGLPLLGPTS